MKIPKSALVGDIEKNGKMQVEYKILDFDNNITLKTKFLQAKCNYRVFCNVQKWFSILQINQQKEKN